MIYNSLNLEAVKFTASNDTRPALASVFFKRNATIGTDGYKLVEISTSLKADEDSFVVNGKKQMAGCEPFLLTASEVKTIKLKEAKDKISGVGLGHLDNDKAELLIKDANGEGVRIIKRVNDKFPDYANLFPAGEPKAQVMLNSDYMAQVAELCGKLKTTTKGMTMKFYGDDKPLVIEASNDEQYIRALIMPIRQ